MSRFAGNDPEQPARTSPEQPAGASQDPPAGASPERLAGISLGEPYPGEPYARLDPAVGEAFQGLESAPPIWELSVSDARERERTIHAALNPPTRTLHRSSTISVEGPGGAICCEVHVPRRSSQALPLVVYLHGGGCVLLDPAAYRPLTTAIAQDADCIVLVPRYRLAPEHPFPAAVEDALAVYRWAIEAGASVGADPERVALCGDSAGGCLSAAITLDCLRTGAPQPRFQALIYPLVDMADDWPSAHAADVADTMREVQWLTGLYAHEHRRDPMASPLLAESHRGLAPALILAAEVDPLLDQGRAYARALADSGVRVTHVTYSAMPHGFLSMSGRLEPAALALSQLAGVLRRELHR